MEKSILSEDLLQTLQRTSGPAVTNGGDDKLSKLSMMDRFMVKFFDGKSDQMFFDANFSVLAHFPGANPTIVSYNAGVVKIYSATNSIARFSDKNYFSLA
jgi:hypothetical protein